MNYLDYEFIKKLKALPFVDKILLFGSRARGDHQERSDIDLAIMSSKATDIQWSIVKDIIETADTLLKIDCLLLDKDKVENSLYRNILKEGKIIYIREMQLEDHFYILGRALDRLQDVIEHPQLYQIDYMRDAAIQRFEFTIELFWKTLKKILLYEKIESVSPRDVLNKAYQCKMINDESIWLKMLDDRNNTSHAYNEEVAKAMLEHIKGYMHTLRYTYSDLKKRYQLY